jgi:plastocyanin
MSSIARRSLLSIAATLAVLAGLVASALPVAAAGVTVRITDDGFDPARIRVAPGTVVTWVNRDDERHRVRTTSGPDKIDSGNLEPGERWSVRLDAAGTYVYLDHRDEDDARYRGGIVVTSGSGGDSGSGGSAGDSGADGAAETNATVGMAGKTFLPGTVTIAAGGTVTFRNDDDDEHTATGTGGSFDTGTLSPGESKRQRFTEPGTYAFLCAFHSDMTGEVVVKPATGSAPTTTPKPTPTPTPTPTPAPTVVPSADAGTDAAPSTLTIVDFEFQPGSLSVPAGSTVDVVNAGVAPHTVTAQDGSFDTGMLEADARSSLTLDTPGTFAFLCSVHPDMTGTIEVLATAEAGGSAAPAGIASPLPTEDATSAGASSPDAATAGISVLPAADVLDLAGILMAVLLVGGGMLLFMKTIAGSVRRSG